MSRHAFGSAYASASALASRPPLAIANLTEPGSLEAAIAARSFRNELILFSFDFCGISEALSLVLTLRQAGFEHFLPLSDGRETCEAMRLATRHWSPPVPCFFSSAPSDHPGWASWGSGPGCVSASVARAAARSACVLEQLWTTRYHVAALLLGAGVNLLHMDTDSAVLSDPYAQLKAPPLREHSLVLLPESPANGGLWYAQNTRRGAGAHWLIGEVARRTLRVIGEVGVRRGRKALPPFDQTMLGDVLHTAADGGRAHWDAACEHPLLRTSHLCARNLTGGPGNRRFRWEKRVRVKPPTESAAVVQLAVGPLTDSSSLSRGHASQLNMDGGGSRSIKADDCPVGHKTCCPAFTDVPFRHDPRCYCWPGAPPAEAGAYPELVPVDCRPTTRPQTRRTAAELAEFRLGKVRAAGRGAPEARRPRAGGEAGGASAEVASAVMKVASLAVAGVDRVETAATAPPWTFPSAWDAQQRGLYGTSPASLGVVHLLGARCRWCESSEDVDHGSKWEWQHLSGFYPAGAYTLAPPLNATAVALAAANDGANERLGGDASATEPPALIRSPHDLARRTELHCAAKGRARLLYADRKVLMLARNSVALARAEAADDGGAAARLLVRRLLVLASLTGRVAVVPSFNCSSAWIRKQQRASGDVFVHDLRVVVVDVAAAAPVHAQRCAPCNVQFGCRAHVLSEAQFAAASALSGAPRGEPLPLSLPLAPSPSHLASVDLPALWRSLRSTSAVTGRAVGESHVLTIDSPADAPSADACSLDRVLLGEERPLAAGIAALHCGVHSTWRPRRMGCDASESGVAHELRAWERGIGTSSCGRSRLLARLAARCSDMLCSERSCFASALEACEARLRQRSAATTSPSAVRGGCEAWLRALPLALGPRCDATTGACSPPPEAYPGTVAWPSAACLGRKPRHMCEPPAGAPSGTCALCVT